GILARRATKPVTVPTARISPPDISVCLATSTAADCSNCFPSNPAATFAATIARNWLPSATLQDLGWPASRSCKAAQAGAGDGNRTHDTQLGKLMFYH